MQSRSDADALLQRILPDLDALERDARRAEPGLTPAQTLDRALQRALGSLRIEMSRETVAYIMWQARRARADAAATRASSEAARLVRAAACEAEEAVRQQGPTRSYVGADGRRWTVREVHAVGVPWAKRDRCLLFVNDEVVRRLWYYPDGWMACTDAELEALSWTV